MKARVAGGVHRGIRLLARPTVEAMATNQLTPEQSALLDPDGGAGWGADSARCGRTTPTRTRWVWC